MRWLLVCVVAALTGCGGLDEILDGRPRGNDLLILILVVGAISIAAAWGFLSKRSSQPSRQAPAQNTPKRPARVILGPDAGASGDRLRAPDGVVAIVPFESIAFALRDGYQRVPTVHMRTPDGAHVLIDEDQVPIARERGFWPMTPSEIATLTRQ